eukprot:1358444-Amphidinium_carterae.1
MSSLLECFGSAVGLQQHNIAVVRNSLAAAQGVQKGDELVYLNGEWVTLRNQPEHIFCPLAQGHSRRFESFRFGNCNSMSQSLETSKCRVQGWSVIREGSNVKSVFGVLTCSATALRSGRRCGPPSLNHRLNVTVTGAVDDSRAVYGSNEGEALGHGVQPVCCVQEPQCTEWME